MPARAHRLGASLDPATAAAVAALEHDPFYRSICAGCTEDETRRAVLAQYFDYSIREGDALGRLVHLADRARGVAVWLLPQPFDVKSRAAQNKRRFLETTLTAEGCANYHSIVEYMRRQAESLVAGDTWYLSIVAVDPAAQGQGLGRKLLGPTLTEADGVNATCYLETFSPQNISFYERLGFAAKAQFAEPTTGADYVVMVRDPSAARDALVGR